MIAWLPYASCIGLYSKAGAGRWSISSLDTYEWNKSSLFSLCERFELPNSLIDKLLYLLISYLNAFSSITSDSYMLILILGTWFLSYPNSFAPWHERLFFYGPTLNMSSSSVLLFASESILLFSSFLSCLSCALRSYSSRLLAPVSKSIAYSKKPFDCLEMLWSSADRIRASLSFFLVIFGFPPDDFDSESDKDSTVLEQSFICADVFGLFRGSEMIVTGVYALFFFGYNWPPRLLCLTCN